MDIEHLKMMDPVNEGDKSELQILLGNKSLQRALGAILRETDMMDKISIIADLDTERGHALALKLQGRVVGRREAIDTLLNFGEDENGR
jgi:hypothetical protein